jgi:stage III sporulation protein AG
LDEWIRNIRGEDEKKVLSKWEKKGKYLVVVVVCLGLLALIWPQGKSVPQEAAKLEIQNSSRVAQAKTSLAGELQSILSQVEGAGKVQVSLTLSSDGLKSYARNTKNERRETQEMDKSGGDRTIKEDNQVSDIAVSGGSALLVQDSAPEVVGVLVVADGAGNGLVKERLTDATSTLLNISPHQVRVVARKGDNQ